MSNNFDWRTEEDPNYSQPGWDLPPAEEPVPVTKRRVSWRLAGLIATLVLLAGAIVWWRVDRRIDATMQAVRSDVVASHNLVQRAAVEGDEELFRSMLSGREPAWTASQFELFRHHLLVDRQPLGLLAAAESLPAVLPLPDTETGLDMTVAAVDVAADLNEAMVTIDQTFQEEAYDDPVTLRQTTVYRRGDQRWLLSPPTDEFWGDWNTANRRYLSLIYPQRDAGIAERLLDDLNADIERLCRTLDDISCSSDLYLTVRLDDDPATLGALVAPMGALRRAQEAGDILELPAPTLVGVPVGNHEEKAEAGYQALRRAYTRQIAGAVVARAVNWRCCAAVLPFQILLDFQLSELGLRTWPVGVAERRDILENSVRLEDLRSYWYIDDATHVTPEQLQRLYTAMDFLIHTFPANTPAKMQRTLSSAENYRGFLNTFMSQQTGLGAGDWIPGHLGHAWWLYAFQGSLDSDAPEPPFPSDDLYMACTSPEGNPDDPSILYRFVPETGRWEEQYRLNGFIWMSALADPSAMLLQEYDMLAETWRTNIWRDGLQPAVLDGSSFSISFGESSPDGSKLLTYGFGPSDGSSVPYIVDLDRCEGGCATTQPPGLPVWAPDGEHAVYTRNGNNFPDSLLLIANQRYILLGSLELLKPLPLELGPGNAELGATDLIAVGEGHAPFWLDEQTFGYIRSKDGSAPGMPSHQEIVIATTADPEPQLLVASADLLRFLPDHVNKQRVKLGYVATHPQRPGQLFIVALDVLDTRAYLLVHDVASGRTEFRFESAYEPNHSLGFSPDGRYLLVTGQDVIRSSASDPGAILLLHDIDANRTIPFLTRFPFFLPSVVYDWSNDGRWLAMAMDDNLIGIVAPDEGYVQVIPHNYGACTSIAWHLP